MRGDTENLRTVRYTNRDLSSSTGDEIIVTRAALRGILISGLVDGNVDSIARKEL